MSFVIAENVGLAFGAEEVLRAVNFRIGESDRVGLVGPNGEGKTTLLRMIAGTLEPTAGDIHRRHGIRIGHLPQDPPALDGTTIHAAMQEVFADLRQMEQELHDLAERMGDDPDHVTRYGALQHRFEVLGGYDCATRIEQVLTGLGFPREMWDRPLSQLSGGQRTRAYLGKLLLRPPDLLLLDEPTNHLDIESCEWLERWLGSFRGALVVVSHDRYLLDHVTTSTWDIAFRRLETYPGPYSKYLTLRAARHSERMQEWEAQQEYIAKTEEFIRIHMGSQRTNEAKGRRTRLERFKRDEAVARPQEHRTISLKLSAAKRTGDMVLRAEGLTVGYKPAEPLLEAKGLELVRGGRVAVVGANGTGKTTLVRTLMGELPPLAGTVRLGANVHVGYLSQTHAELDPDITALEAVRDAGKGVTEERARTLLGSLLLTGDNALKQVGQLSGGQRSRVLLARLMIRNANLLMLDEPTNHLDIASMEIIQAALQDFDGTAVFVSHDRYLVQALATQIWAIDGGEVRTILGGWEEYVAWRAEHRAGAKAANGAGGTDKRQSWAEREAARKEDNKLRRRLNQLEKEIERAERELAHLNEGMAAAAQSGALDSLRELSREHQRQSEKLKALWEEWEQVGERIEGQ